MEPMKVVPLVPRTSQVDASIVARLEDTLALAKEGKIEAVGLAIVYREGGTDTSLSQTDDAARLLAAITILQDRLLRVIRDSS